MKIYKIINKKFFYRRTKFFFSVNSFLYGNIAPIIELKNWFLSEKGHLVKFLWLDA